MRYELLLQSQEPGSPFPAARVVECLKARGATITEDGTGVWRLSHGDIALKALREANVQVATELHAKLSEKADGVRELVREAFAVASDTQVRLFDPQLARSVGPADEEAVAEQFLQLARYAGEMAGISSAIGASFSAEPQGLKSGTKVLLGLVGLCVLLYFLSQGVLTRLR